MSQRDPVYVVSIRCAGDPGQTFIFSNYEAAIACYTVYEGGREKADDIVIYRVNFRWVQGNGDCGEWTLLRGKTSDLIQS